MTRRLIHYSSQPRLREPLTLTEQRHPYGDMTGSKPRGLWVSAEGDDDWREWCLAEKFWLHNIRHMLEVKLKPDAKVLRIVTPVEMETFSERYGADLSPQAIAAAAGTERAEMMMEIFGGDLASHVGIDWRKVAAEFQGIVIAPYQYGYRMHHDFFWYYPWDCASGCIWDPAAIADISVLSERGVDEKAIRRCHHARMKYAPRKRKKLFRKHRIIRMAEHGPRLA